jgi:glycosyltransferase involved in cell wall biosynthesis
MSNNHKKLKSKSNSSNSELKTSYGIKQYNKQYPFVSLCTPTFNRRPFIQVMIKCFEHQTYPKNRIEWIIVDDGTDPIEDLVKHIPQVKYFYSEKMNLGKKRNFMHSKCTGDIIVYMDDDDYYPPERVEHAVEMLKANPDKLIAGSSEMHMYFESRKQVFQCGPYGDNHATAATYAFKKELLEKTKYDDIAAVSEEAFFTRGFTIPMVQLDTLKTILAFSHNHSSFNKEKLLENPELTKTYYSRFSIDDFIKEPDIKQFYMNDVSSLLEFYNPGRPENKPEVLEQIRIKEENIRIKEEQYKAYMKAKEQAVTYLNENIENIKADYEQQLANKNIIINQLLKRIKTLTK